MADPTRTALDKAMLRRSMRERRRALDDRARRSLAIWEHVRQIPAVVGAARLLVFETIAGEPETSAFVDACRARGLEIRMPHDEIDPSWPDVVIVPGLAFTATGDRLGQGGGWYDRFLSGRRADCTTVGVCFDLQLVDALPVEPHDVRLDFVATESGIADRSISRG